MKIESHGVKYLGSKRTLNAHIIDLISSECKDIKSVIDVFTGTTRVAQAFIKYGFETLTSDLSWASEAYAYTFIHNNDNSHLQKYIDELNGLQGYAGWLTNNYCDVKSVEGTVVRVWQVKNGRRADAIRDKIEGYDLEHWEKMTLITSLIFALDAVDNTVGIQQAYLKQWCTRSHNDLVLKLPKRVINPLIDSVPVKSRHIVGDALEIEYPAADLVYLDPPYSSIQYSTFYHIWDSIVRWDKPAVKLSTNRREDRTRGNNELVSEWSYKTQAKDAFQRLLDRLDARYILISYSSDSIVPVDELLELCETKGVVTIKSIDYKRNIMCKIGSQGDGEYITENQEFLILINRSSVDD